MHNVFATHAKRQFAVELNALRLGCLLRSAFIVFLIVIIFGRCILEYSYAWGYAKVNSLSGGLRFRVPQKIFLYCEMNDEWEANTFAFQSERQKNDIFETEKCASPNHPLSKWTHSLLLSMLFLSICHFRMDAFKFIHLSSESTSESTR